MAAICVLCPVSAKANVVIAPIVLLAGFTSVAAFWTGGLTLAGVTIIEGEILRRREKLDWKRAYWLSGKANLISTLLGLGIALSASMGELFFLAMPIILMALTDGAKEKLGIGFGNVVVRLIVSVGLTIGVLWLAMKTVPGTLLRPLKDFPDQRSVHEALIAGVGIFVFGFLLSVLSEARTIGKDLGRPVLGTVLLMNLVSYTALGLIMSRSAKSVVADRKWYWHPKDFKNDE